MAVQEFLFEESIINYRSSAAAKLPAPIGVYALCDLDEVPIYVGQSTDGIRNRVRRHITSARSDIIANRQIDVWEIAFVWCWPVGERSWLDLLEAYLFHEFHSKSPLMNGTIPHKPEGPLGFDIPEKIVVQVLPSDEIENRKHVDRRLPRQAKHFSDLLDHFLNVKDTNQLHQALKAHFSRVQTYFERLRPSSSEQSE